MIGAHTDHFSGTLTPSEAYATLRTAQTADRNAMWIGVLAAVVAVVASGWLPGWARELLAVAGLASLYAIVRLLDMQNRDMLMHMLDLDAARRHWEHEDQRRVHEAMRDLRGPPAG